MSKRPYIRQYTNSNNIVIVPTMCFSGDPPSKKQKSVNSIPNYMPEACSNPQTGKKTIGTVQETKNSIIHNSVTDLNKKNLSNSSVEVNINKKGCMDPLPKKDECDFVMHEPKETKTDFNSIGFSWASSFIRSIGQSYDKPKRLTLSSKKKKDHLSETAVPIYPHRICHMKSTTSVREFTKKVTPNSEDTKKVKSKDDIRTLTNKPLIRNKTQFENKNSSKLKNKNDVNMGVGVIHKIISKESLKPLSHADDFKIIQIEKRGKSAFKNENLNDLSFNIRDVHSEIDINKAKIKITSNPLKCSSTIDKQKKLVKRTESSTCLEDKTSKPSLKNYQVIETKCIKINTNNCANKITNEPPTKILSKLDKGSKEKQLYDLHNRHTNNIQAHESLKSMTQIPDSSKFNKNSIISFSDLKVETSKSKKSCRPESQHIFDTNRNKSERKTKIKSDRSASPPKKHRGSYNKDKIRENLHETNKLLVKKNEGKFSEKIVNVEILSKLKSGQSGSQIIDKENKISKSKGTINSDNLKSIIKLHRFEKNKSKTNNDNIFERKSSPPVKRIDNLHENKQVLFKKDGGKVSDKIEVNVKTSSKLGSGKSESQKNTDKENKLSKSEATIKSTKLKSIIKNPHGSEKIKSKTINDSICERRSSHPVKSVKQEQKNFEHLKQPLSKPKVDTYFDLRTKLLCRNLSTLITKIRNEKYIKSTNKVPREERENLIITVENDIKDNDVEFEDILLKNKNIKLQDEYMKPRIKKQKKGSKAQRSKKIKLVINIKTRKQLASSSEDNVCIKKDKVIPEKNPDLSFLDDFNIDEIVNSLDNNVKESDVCESNVSNLKNSDLFGTDVLTPDATEDYENIYNIQQHINNFNREKMDVCERDNEITKSQKHLHFSAQRSSVQEIPIKVLDATIINSKKGADAESNTGASYLKALLGDLDSQSENIEAPLDKSRPVTSQVSHANESVFLFERKNSTATLEKLDPIVSQADHLLSLFEYDSKKACLDKLVSQDSKVGELASPFKCENSKATLDKLEPTLSQADELVSQADELVSLFRTDKATFNKFELEASQVSQADKYMEKLPCAYIDLTDETDIEIKLEKKEIESIEITEDDAEKKTFTVENTEPVQAVVSDSNKAAKTNSVITKHETDIPKTLVNSAVKNALDFPCEGEEAKIQDDKAIEEKVCSKIFPISNMNEVDKLIAKQLENRMIEYFNEKYNITSIIKSGQYSKIYRCQDSRGVDRALKLMNNKMYSENQRMLMNIQEDIPIDNLKCVYIINSFAFLGKRGFLMEYYPKNLAEALMENMGPFHINVVQDLSRQLVTAVMVLRNNNIVHSDIKPSHILLNSANDSLKLCGFDAAFTIDCVQLLPSLGTINYRAPEVILCYSAGYGIDVWATALVMYEMATNIQLFPGIYNNDILYKQMCTLGNIPYDMLRDSWCKNQHFVGTSFKRLLGANPLNYLLKNNFFKSNRLKNTIYHAYRLTGSQNKVQRNRDLTKVDDFYTLLEQMLALHPKERLDIEYVYAHPFILQ